MWSSTLAIFVAVSGGRKKLHNVRKVAKTMINSSVKGMWLMVEKGAKKMPHEKVCVVANSFIDRKSFLERHYLSRKRR